MDLRPQPIGGFGIAYLLVICVLLPWAAWKSRQRSRGGPLPERKKYFLNALQTGAFLGILGLLVAWNEAIELFPAAIPPASAIGWGLAALALLVLGMSRYWEYVARRRERRMQLFCEPTRGDRALWLLISLSAGFWEEIVYRGVTTVLLARFTGSVPAAIAIAVVVFALAHLHRGVRGTILVVPIALLLHGLVFVAGSLYVAMAVHFLYDAIAGFGYMHLARKYGITRETPKTSAPPASAS